jgi:hypothetical protein
MSVSFYLEKAKDLAAVAGIGGVLWSAYSVSGLPVPATIKQVEEKIAAVQTTIGVNQRDTNKQLDSMRIEQIDGQRAVIRLTRVSLRNEQTSLERMVEGLRDPVASTTMRRRLGEIGDQLKELDASEGELRDRISKLRG